MKKKAGCCKIKDAGNLRLLYVILKTPFEALHLINELKNDCKELVETLKKMDAIAHEWLHENNRLRNEISKLTSGCTADNA